MSVRVRFAPSPTGALHIGGVRTALYNYLFARKNKGTFILRVEDTDQTRYVEGAEEYIFNTLNWLGIEPDESPIHGGPHKPYRQSERKGRYGEFAQQLVDAGLAYYAFDTPEELEAMRERLKAARVASPQYNSITRETMKNSLTLSADEVEQRISNGDPYVVRIKIPRKEEVRLNDMVRGWVMVHSSAIDDKVILKADGMPTYHLANVVDDYQMGITHVIRGEEWLPSAPLHVLLYKFLGWEKEMPRFAHLPLLLKPDGNGKLSKRDAEKHGFPIFPLEWSGNTEKLDGFREQGYLPEAMINFLAFLGWNPGTHQEIFSKEELIEAFSVERIGKSGTKFDIDKAKWFNQQYLKNYPADKLADMLKDQAQVKGSVNIDDALAQQIAELLRDRLTFPGELWEQGKIFFEMPTKYDEKVVSKKFTADVNEALTFFAEKLDSAVKTEEDYSRLIQEAAESRDISPGKMMQPLRVSLTGMPSGPELKTIMVIMGPEEVSRRIDVALKKVTA